MFGIIDVFIVIKCFVFLILKFFKCTLVTFLYGWLVLQSKMTSIKAHFKSTNVYTEGTNFHNNDLPTVAIKITTPNFQKKIEVCVFIDFIFLFK